MLAILAITGPIYLIIAGGWLAVRHGLFEKADTRVLGRFVTNICLPALLFRALSSHPVRDVLNLQYLLAYGGASMGLMLLWRALNGRLLGQGPAHATLQGLGMSSSNSAYVSYPIAAQLLGAPAAIGLALTMLVENVLVIPLALALADRQGEDSRSFAGLGRTLAGLLRNPMIVAIIAGFTVSLTGLPLPGVLARTIDVLASASSPVSLFVIGGTLVGLQMNGLWARVGGIAAAKLLVHPAVTVGLMLLMPGIDPALRTAGLIYAAAPMLSILPILAQKHHMEALSAAALLVATAFSFATISLWLWVAHHLPGLMG